MQGQSYEFYFYFVKLLKKKVGEMMKKTKENYVSPFLTLNFVYDA